MGEVFIDEATLYLRQVKISPAVMLQHAMVLEKAAIKYYTCRNNSIYF
jgi:hypothetical protein